MYEVGCSGPSNFPGNSYNNVDKLVAAVELLTKQVSNMRSEINSIKVMDTRVTVLTFVIEGVGTIVKILIEPLVTIVLNVARLTIWPEDVEAHH